MTELQLQKAPQDENAATIENQAYLGMDLVLTGLEDRGIAIENRESTIETLETINKEFALNDEVFSDFKRTVVLVAAANHLANLEDENSRAKEMEYVADIVMGIAGKYTQFDGQLDYLPDKYVPSDEQQKNILEKYTQPELTQQMDEYIRGPKFDNLRARLGKSEAEEPFEVRVLSIDAGNIHGLIPSVDYDDESISYEEHKKEMDFRHNYSANLELRTKQFAEAYGRDDVFAPAWISTFNDGTRYLCLASPLVEKVLYDKEERKDYYSEDYWIDDLAVVEHEYTHTQQMLTEGKINLGISLEELRAEHFSGNHHGYTDIKKFFHGISMLTGYHPSDSFEIEGKPYDQDEFLTEIAKNIGLDGLLDCMTAIPTNYAEDEDANKFIKAIVAHNGGSLGSQFGKIYKKIIQKDTKEVVDARIDDFVDKIYEKTKNSKYVTVESWFAYAGIGTLRDIGIENFRRRYPENSDEVDYSD